MIRVFATARHPFNRMENQMVGSVTGSSGSSVSQDSGISTTGRPTKREDHIAIDMDMDSATYSTRIGDELKEYSTSVDEPAYQVQMDEVRVTLEDFDRMLAEYIEQEPASSSNHAEKFEKGVKELLSGHYDETVQAGSDGDLLEVIVQYCDAPMFKSSGGSQHTDTYIQRTQSIVDFLGELLGKLGRNEFDGNLGRLASNLTIATLHTGLIVGTLTTIRQLLGFAIEKCMQSNAASPLTRNVIGGLSLMIGPALNILGTLRDECNGTANAHTRLSRLATLTLSMAAFGVALAAPQALPALASFGPQMGFYTLARDLVHLFINITDNAQPTAGGVAATGGLYGALQFLAGTAMDTTAPNSGAGYAMSADSGPSTTDNSLAAQLRVWMERATDTSTNSNPSPESRAEEILESLTPVLGHDVLRGAYNGAIEIADKVLGGELMHALQGKKAPEGYRVKFGSAHIPNASQIADGILTTAAMRTSFGQTIMASAISAGTYFASLGLPAAVTNHAVNAVVAAVAIAGFPGFVYAHAGNKPEETITV